MSIKAMELFITYFDIKIKQLYFKIYLIFFLVNLLNNH